jgi:hypothetical protein
LATEGISVKDDSNKSTNPTDKKGVGAEHKGEDTEKHGIGAKLKSAIHKE